MKPRIGIIIPLRAPETTSNWLAVSEICKRTLNSIFQSTSSNYSIVLVCHQAPGGLKNDQTLSVVEMRLPIPTDQEGYKSDKFKKIVEGAKILRKEKFDYIMILDADDLIHRRLIEWIVEKPLCNGYRVHRGWVYGGGAFARVQHNFDAMCGSSIIHRDVPHKSGADPALIPHCCAWGYYITIGKPLYDIPFRAVCKVIGYGENISAGKCFLGPNITSTIKKIFHMRPIGSKFRRDFGIE